MHKNFIYMICAYEYLGVYAYFQTTTAFWLNHIVVPLFNKSKNIQLLSLSFYLIRDKNNQFYLRLLTEKSNKVIYHSAMIDIAGTTPNGIF